MDRVSEYREIICKMLLEYVERVALSDIKTQTLFDKERDHYQLMHVGWRKDFDRVYGIVVHIDIIDGKIWVQEDNTEVGFADRLVTYGVPKSDIVLGFRAPYVRQFTEFAAG